MSAVKSSPIDVARVMRKEAQRDTGKPPTFRILNGWKFGLSYGPVPLPEREVVEHFKGSIGKRMNEPGLAAASYEQIETVSEVAKVTHIIDNQWIFSASLHPRGRSSGEEDWKLLGMMLAAIGAPEDSIRTPFETTHPNDVHYWIWTEPVAS